MTGGQPHSSWAVSLANVKGGVFQVLPGVVKAGTDVVSCSTPWWARL